MIKIKNINKIPEKDDGFRIYMDDSWPDDVSKKEAEIDLCLKDIAPSTKLSESFKMDPTRWSEFKEGYQDELRSKKTLISLVRNLEKEHDTITLVYSAENDNKNSAVLLRDKLEGYRTIHTHIDRIHGG